MIHQPFTYEVKGETITFENWYDPIEVFGAINNDASSGIYAIRLQNKTAFKDYNVKFQEEYIGCGEPDIVYIGMAGDTSGIFKRLEQELLQEGKATFFRSIGALLNFNPMNNQRGRNITNYTFATREKNEIISFLRQNILISYVHKTDNQKHIESLEMCLIQALKPIINIKHNPYKSPVLKAERARCRIVAKAHETLDSSTFAESK